MSASSTLSDGRATRAAWLLAAALLATSAAAAGWIVYLGPRPTPPAQLMRAGLDALYQRNDPRAAAATFRQVLEARPAHYAATYQLAIALDRAGDTDQALDVWRRVLATAESVGDDRTAATARSRLAAHR